MKRRHCQAKRLSKQDEATFNRRAKEVAEYCLPRRHCNENEVAEAETLFYYFCNPLSPAPVGAVYHNMLKNERRRQLLQGDRS